MIRWQNQYTLYELLYVSLLKLISFLELKF